MCTDNIKVKILARLFVGHLVVLHQDPEALLGVVDDAGVLLAGLLVVHEHDADDGLVEAVGKEDVLVRINVLDVFPFHAIFS